MPKRKTSRRSRNVKRRRYSRKKLTIRKPIPFGIPQKKLVKLRYVESIQLNPGTVANAFHDFSTNSIYDPNSSVGGHQPLFHDQYANLYGRYTVLGSKCIVKCMPNSSTAQIPGMWSVCINRVSNALSGKNSDDIIEQKYSSPYQVRSNGGNASFGGRDKPVVKKWSARKYLGLGRGTVINHADSQANFGANPAKQHYFTIWCAHTGLTNDPPAFDFLVTIDYICLLTEPKIQAQS